jgi:carbonic anhydrase
MTQVIYRQATDENPPLPRDGTEALAWLADGNNRFATAAAGGPDADRTLVIDGDFGIGAVLGRRPEPRPFGIVLGCSDSRVPVELVFGRAVNELFVVRVAGNAIGNDAIGSIHYAMDHFGTLQTIVVLGHTLCGAVATAVDAFLKPRRYLELATRLALRALVDRMEVSVRVAAMALQGEHGTDIAMAPGYGWALLDLAVYLNAAYVAFSIDAGLSAADRSRVAVAYGVYDVTTRRVSAGAGTSSAFEAPPEGADGFRTLARALASAPHIMELLHGRRSPAGLEHMVAAHAEPHA